MALRKRLVSFNYFHQSVKFRLGGAPAFHLWPRPIMLAIIPDWWVAKGTFSKEVVTVPSILSAPAVPDSLWQPVEEGSTPSDCLVLWNSSLAVNAGTLFLISVSEFLNFPKLFFYFLFLIFVRWCDTSFHWCAKGIWCDCLGLVTSQSHFSSLLTVSFQIPFS